MTVEAVANDGKATKESAPTTTEEAVANDGEAKKEALTRTADEAVARTDGIGICEYSGIACAGKED